MLGKKLVLGTSTKFFVYGFSIIASIIAARLLGPTVLGTVAGPVAFVNMFTFILGMGIGSAHIKRVSEGKDLGKCNGTFIFLKVIFLLIFLIVTISGFIIFKYALHRQFESEIYQQIILIAIVGLILKDITGIGITTFSARTEQARSDLVSTAESIFTGIFKIIVAIMGWGAVALAISPVMATLLITPLAYYYFRDYPISRWDKEYLKSYLQFGVPIFLVNMVNKYMHNLDKVMIDYFWDAREVGIYSGGERLSTFILMISNTVGLLFFPTFSRLYAENNVTAINRTIIKYERFLYLFLMPLLITIMIFSPQLVKITLGKEYSGSAIILSILAFSTFIMTLNTPFGNLMLGANMIKLSAIISIIFLILSYIGNLFFISPAFLSMAALGAAIATGAVNIIYGVSARVIIRIKIAGIKVLSNLHLAIYGILSFILLLLINRALVHHLTTIQLFIIPLLYLILTYALFFMLKWLTRDDFMLVWENIRISNIISYIKSELKKNASKK